MDRKSLAEASVSGNQSIVFTSNGKNGAGKGKK